jgi:FkbM family methyltransferase
MPLATAATYYAGSIPRLLKGFKRPLRVGAALLGLVRFPIEVEVRPSGLRFRVRDAMDLWILKETCLDDAYVPGGVRPEPGWTVLDVGGGIGDFAVMMGSRCPAGTVHSYEPMADSFSLLEHNLALNRVTNVFAHQAAVAAGEGELTPRLPDLQPAALTRYVKDPSGEARVPARDLASVLDALPGAECDFMKIDCEGCEFDLLLSADPALLDRIHRMSLEFHDGFTPHRGTDLARHLRSHGYHVRLSGNPVHRRLGQIYAERVEAPTPKPRPRRTVPVRGAPG